MMIVMIEDEAQYKHSVKMLKDWRKRFVSEKQRLAKEGYTPEEVKRITDPAVSFYLGIADDIEYYESQKMAESENV